jgi:DNA repair protein RecO (recombination protein O)
MKVEQQPAYLLHARPFSESSLLVDLFTREYGRLMVIAKGARRGKTRSRGVLLPFKPLLVSWSGKGQLPILTSAEQGQHTREMKGRMLTSGFYLNELVLRLLHRHDAHESLFDHYHIAASQLAQENSPHQVLRIFEKKLLQEIGFGLVLDHDAETGEAISPQQQYHYVVEKGPVCAEQPGEYGIPGEQALTVSGGTLYAMHEERFKSDSELQEARRLTRALIDRELNGRPLRSRRVMLEMNKFTQI